MLIYNLFENTNNYGGGVILELEIQEKKQGLNFRVFILSLVMVMAMSAFTSLYAGSRTIVAEAKSAADAFNQVQNSQGGVLGEGIENKITGISADAQSITLSVVMGILICSTLWTTTAFNGAGDNPQKKAQLKNALIFQIGGIIFAASYSGMILFGLQNLNLF